MYFPTFGIKDLIDILCVALLLFYLYKMMRRTGSLNMFIGIIIFVSSATVASSESSGRISSGRYAIDLRDIPAITGSPKDFSLPSSARIL